jgi:hypothetical protein
MTRRDRLNPTELRLLNEISTPEQREAARLVRRRQVVVSKTTYTAFSTNDLLEYDSIGNYGRPGMPY